MNTIKIKLFLVYLAILFLPNTKTDAQQLERTLLSSSGSFMTTDNLQLGWSIGETVVAYLENGNIKLSQGFNQFHNVINGIFSPPEWDMDITIYPNPVQHYLNLKSETLPDLQLTIYDVFGKLIRKDTWKNYLKTIDVSNLNGGVYLITLKNSNGNFASYKIVKQ